MKRFLRLFSPRRAASDFKSAWDQPTPHRWPILGVAAAFTFAVFTIAVPNTEYGEPERPEVIYYEGFEPGRTDEEIRLANIRNQCVKDLRAEQEEARAERRRDLYRALGDATGLDTAEMEREIAEQEAAERAAAGLPAQPEPEEKPYDCSQFEDLTAAG